MKKFLLGGVVVALLGGYALWTASRSAVPVPVATTSAPSETTNPHGGTMMGNTSTGMMGGGGMMSGFKDGTYKGSVGSAAPYGNVQVSATISGGKLTSIQVLEKPQGPGVTNQIAAEAFPKLIQEAIKVQTEKVAIISGATQDCEGFQASLASALSQAQS